MALTTFPTPGAGRTTVPSLQNTITSSQTVTIPSNVDTVYFIAVGGGGGGGNAVTDSAGPSGVGGGGGGAGFVNMGSISGIQLSNKLSITIGAGGAINGAGGTTIIGDRFFTASGGQAGYHGVAVNGGTFQGTGGSGMSGGGMGGNVIGGAGGANGANGSGSLQNTFGSSLLNGLGNSYLTFKAPGGGGGGNGFIFTNAGSAGSSTAGTTSSGGAGGFRTAGTAGVLGQGGGGGGCNSTSDARAGAAGGSGVVYLYY